MTHAELARNSHGELASCSLPARRRDVAIQFDSRSEAAIAILLEKYLPDWECIPGKTFQVPAAGKLIDFRVGNIFLEYHPIVFRREFANSDAHQRLIDALRTAPAGMKIEIWRALRDELASQYWLRRRQALDAAGHRGCRLVVAVSPDDLHDRFFASVSGCPNKSLFCSAFRRLLREI